MGCAGPTAETAEIVLNAPTIRIAKIREDIRGLSLGCHDYLSLFETAPPPKSLQPMVTVHRGYGWLVVFSRRPPGKPVA
jgi:citrate lyase beta subunit